MKSAPNGILMSLMVACALTVGASSWLEKMQGQDAVPKPALFDELSRVESPSDNSRGEELPGRDQSAAPALSQGSAVTPFSQIPDLPAGLTNSSDTNGDAETTDASEPPRKLSQRTLRPSYSAPPQVGGDIELPNRMQTSSPNAASSVTDSSPMNEPSFPQTGTRSGTVGPESIPFFGLSPQSIGPTLASPTINMPLPQIGRQVTPTIAPSQAIDLNQIQNRSVPVGNLALGGEPCPHCASTTCTICCQPRCITRTIMVPQWSTVWNSVFETRYRTDIKEEAYTIEQVVEHQVPEIIQETVMVPEPRIRTFQEFRSEEFQVPVKEPYSVTVRKPKQRMVPVDREETFKVPFEEKYTVMVPQEKIVSETKYKTITDKEPREIKYTVDVEREKKRFVLDYEDKEFVLKKQERFIRPVQKTLTRKKLRYENVTATRPVQYEEIVYKERFVDVIEEELEDGKKQSPIRDEEVVEYKPLDRKPTYDQPVVVQTGAKIKKQHPYTVAVPQLVTAYENYTVSKPYEEEVTISWNTRRQVPREIVQKYDVRIPYIENIPRQYRIKVPHQVMKKGKRTVPKQIPRTRYQIVKRDMGRWETEICTLPTYEVSLDLCGCSTCCPKTRTVRRTVWKPNVVTSKIPYTVFDTVKQEVEFEYPVLEYSYETRDRMEAITKYRVEPREAKLTVYDFVPGVETKTVKVTKYEQVPMQRKIEIQKFTEEKRFREYEFSDYKTNRTVKQIPIDINVPVPVIAKKTVVIDGEPKVVPKRRKIKIIEPVPVTRTRMETYVKRVPVFDTETYTKTVEIEDSREVKKVVKVKMPIPRIETYIEKVPEIRTRIEYVDVKKRVPVVETKTVTEMVPETRSRTVYKTETRTVAELKPEMYFEDEVEVFERTVYKKKVRNVPVNRAEIYWVKVPKVLKKTVFKTVKKKIKRPALRRVPIRVPYQHEERIPRRVCTMVAQTITIPIEECCEHCVVHLPGVAAANEAYSEYGNIYSANFLDWVRQGATTAMPVVPLPAVVEPRSIEALPAR